MTEQSLRGQKSKDPRLAYYRFAYGTGDPWHDGPGWYYWDEEYTDEGVCGAFETLKEAEEHALEGELG